MSNDLYLTESLVDLCEDFDIVSDTANWQVFETMSESSQSKVDGVHVLARVVGPGFLIDGDSKNGRHYNKAVWEQVKKTRGPIIESKGLIGTCGHDTPLCDRALMDGTLTHKLTKLWFDENHMVGNQRVGMIEMLILGTDGGENLNHLIRSGYPVPVSSRALGRYVGKTSAGTNIVEASTFFLEAFDFVLSPGVAEACPRLLESLQRPTYEKRREVFFMSGTESNPQAAVTTLSEQLGTAKSELTQERSLVETLKRENSALTARLGLVENVAKVEEMAEIGEGIKALAKDIGSDHSQAKNQLKAVASIVESYNKLGKPEEIAEQLKLLAQYEKKGTVEELSKVFKNLHEYTSFGTVKDVSDKLREHGLQKAAIQEAEKKVKAAALAKENSISEDLALSLLKKNFTDVEIKEHISLIRGNGAPPPTVSTNNAQSPNSPNTPQSANETGLDRLLNKNIPVAEKIWESFAYTGPAPDKK